ncbi:MAG: hypothetical protein A2X46_10745 [Lentisphaerae bacterium GWF2_57_35]|nr:MAG: hypothetical protein A2X46_10745 [Lentisphaerae bacterium GWF2_57_35]
MLRTKLFKYFALLVIVVGGLSTLVGFRIIKRQVIDEAQHRVRLDLGSAWALQNARLHDIEIILRLIAGKKIVLESAQGEDWTGAYLQDRLRDIQTTFGLDYLGIVSADGHVVLRTTPPHQTGDNLSAHAMISRALRGQTATGFDILSPSELERESPALAEQAHITLEVTPRSRPDSRHEERQGLVMAGAVPIMHEGALEGVLYGGILLNRNEGVVDNLKNVMFKNETYQGASLGTVTIFLDDCRVATTVTTTNGTRAVGTRVSAEVAEQVLDHGLSWIGRAFVVRDWHLTAYDPIRDLDGKILGMLYVGLLEKPFRDLEAHLLLRYAGLLLFGLLGALTLAYFLARHLADPIHRLLKASRSLQDGENPQPVALTGVCEETDGLVRAFNDMAAALADREMGLKKANEKKERAIEALRSLNQSYMNVVGFVSHELQGPVASVMNYSYALLQGTLGTLTGEQTRVIRQIQANSDRMVEMVRHYLNLSRIESGEFYPAPARVAVEDEMVGPLLEALQPQLASKKMHVENRIDRQIQLRADPNMTREVFENLLNNAVKYGREGGAIVLSCQRDGALAGFSVRNEGPGIPPEKMDRLFQKFSRLEDGKDGRRTKGTGLGLFITRHIVEAHGGTIDVESHPNEWTEFRFTLPAWIDESDGS